MDERSQGLYSFLGRDSIYRGFQNLVGANRLRAFLVDQVIRPTEGAKFLDVGCGPGDILDFLGRVDYVGFDANPAYIAAAQRRFPGRGRFFCQLFTPQAELPEDRFDRILAIGLLHHLDDASCRQLFELARRHLSPGGSIVTVDACFVPQQSWLGRTLTARDRGANVRTPEGYAALARDVFPEVETIVKTGLIRLPYTHTILRCAVS